MKLLKEDFCSILNEQRVKPVFQPIVSLADGKIVGYEALSRIVGESKIKNSEELFFLAGIYSKIWELEQLCRSRILEKYHDLCGNKNPLKLFLNVNPQVIHDKQFHIGFTSQYLKQYNLKTDNIIFEVTERSAVEDMRGFKDTTKYAMVKSMVEFANLTNIQLIAEGIEREEELKALLKLGVHNGQGYFLRKPNEQLKGVEKEALEVIKKFNRKKTVKNRVNSVAGDFCVVLFKFENYKAYRAYCGKYGDEKGDEMVSAMKEVIADNLADTETIAMLDEDTVVSVIEKKHHKIRCETIVNMFKSKIEK